MVVPKEHRVGIDTLIHHLFLEQQCCEMVEWGFWFVTPIWCPLGWRLVLPWYHDVYNKEKNDDTAAEW